VKELLQAGRWRAALGGGVIDVGAGGSLQATVPAHGVEVYLLDAPVTDTKLRAALDAAMQRTRRN
jgi:cyclomaltodextrin glucanotransferase